MAKPLDATAKDLEQDAAIERNAKQFALLAVRVNLLESRYDSLSHSLYVSPPARARPWWKFW